MTFGELPLAFGAPEAREFSFDQNGALQSLAGLLCFCHGHWPFLLKARFASAAVGSSGAFAALSFGLVALASHARGPSEPLEV